LILNGLRMPRHLRFMAASNFDPQFAGLAEPEVRKGAGNLYRAVSASRLAWSDIAKESR
jgi:hypothetical protein